jgi:hypothetical protein
MLSTETQQDRPEAVPFLKGVHMTGNDLINRGCTFFVVAFLGTLGGSIIGESLFCRSDW